MWTDPIVEETRQARQEYARQFNYDLHAMMSDLRQHEQEHPERLVSLPVKAPRKTKTGS